MEITVPGAGKFGLNVVGVAQYQRLLEHAAKHGAIVEAVLILENTNPHDDQAVAVHLNDERAGYLSRADARRFRADLAAAGAPGLSVRVKAKIVGGFETKGGERAHLGLKLDLPKLSH